MEPSNLALIAAIADELPVGIWVARASTGAFVYANRACVALFGPAPHSGRDRAECSVDHGPHTRAGVPYRADDLPFARVLRTRATVVDDGMVIHRPDGARAYVHVTAKPLFNVRGELEFVVVTFDDVSREVEAERARAEHEVRLRHAQRLESIGSLAGGLAHDFNNLLAAIKLFTGQLRSGERDARRREVLEHIDEVTESAAKLTRALLGFARRGKHLAQRVSLGTVAQRMTELARRTMDRRIELATELRAHPDDVVGDGTQLEQVVMNLLLNGRDAIAGAGRITVRTDTLTLDAAAVQSRPSLEPGRFVKIEVSDTGGGIAPAILDRVFEPYVTTKTSGAIKGTGLGLATAYGIVRSHGGDLEVADTGPHGTTMRVLLPAAAGGAPPAAPTLPMLPAQVQPGSGTLLLIEDEALVRQACAQTLRSMGYTVITAEDGVRGVEQFRAHRDQIVAVVLDMVMPKMDGRDTYLALREMDPEVRVLLTTGLALNEQAQAILDLGVRGFLAKPYDEGSLSEAIARLVSGR